jgi:hypothetical protein
LAHLEHLIAQNDLLPIPRAWRDAHFSIRLALDDDGGLIAGREFFENFFVPVCSHKSFRPDYRPQRREAVDAEMSVFTVSFDLRNVEYAPWALFTNLTHANVPWFCRSSIQKKAPTSTRETGVNRAPPARGAGGGGTVVQNVSIVLENSTRRRSRAKTDGGVLRGRGEANFGGTPLDLAALIAPPSNLRMSGLILPS